jgi:hypothetical protein
MNNKKGVIYMARCKGCGHIINYIGYCSACEAGKIKKRNKNYKVLKDKVKYGLFGKKKKEK